MEQENNYIGIFGELGGLLGNFGSDPASRETVIGAVRLNPWFSESDIKTAARALSESILKHNISEKWLGTYNIAYHAPKDIAVIMAGNIPFAGFFDMICVVASGDRCFAKMSGKDAVLMEYAIELLNTLAGRTVVLPYDDSHEYDAVIASGSDNSNRYFRSRFAGIPSLLRGSRHSLAVLRGDETGGELAGLSEDIFLYNGMGCRNVSLLFIPEGYDIAALGGKIAPEALNPKYINNYRQTKAMHALQSREFIDCGGFILREDRDFPFTPSRINYSFYSSQNDVEQWIKDNENRIQCVVSRGGEYLRGSCFGRAQHPYPWDYPDGVDTMEFLLSLKE